MASPHRQRSEGFIQRLEEAFLIAMALKEQLS